MKNGLSIQKKTKLKENLQNNKKDMLAKLLELASDQERVPALQSAFLSARNYFLEIDKNSENNKYTSTRENDKNKFSRKNPANKSSCSFIRFNNNNNIYCVTQELGKGYTGRATMVIDQSGKIYVVKIEKDTKSLIENRERHDSINVMNALGVPYLLGMMQRDSIKDDEQENINKVYMLIPFEKGKTLDALLKDKQNNIISLSPLQEKIIALKLCERVQYLHRLGIVHNDLHAKNVMVHINPDNPFDITVKEIDYGKSRIIINRNTNKPNIPLSDAVKEHDLTYLKSLLRVELGFMHDEKYKNLVSEIDRNKPQEDLDNIVLLLQADLLSEDSPLKNKTSPTTNTSQYLYESFNESPMHPDLHSMESPPVKIPDILPKAERFMDFLFNIEEKIGANNSTLYTLGGWSMNEPSLAQYIEAYENDPSKKEFMQGIHEQSVQFAKKAVIQLEKYGTPSGAARYAVEQFKKTIASSEAKIIEIINERTSSKNLRPKAWIVQSHLDSLPSNNNIINNINKKLSPTPPPASQKPGRRNGSQN